MSPITFRVGKRKGRYLILKDREDRRQDDDDGTIKKVSQ